MTWHNGCLPEDKVFLKLGGDHGQGSMKMEFQIANVPKPNSPQNTVVFVLFEGKDTRNNLATILQGYKDQVEYLESTGWRYVNFSLATTQNIPNLVVFPILVFILFFRGKAFVSFLYGDYEFLCKVMGISGASGKSWSCISTINYTYSILSREYTLYCCYDFLTGRHPCLWCTILAIEMSLAKDKRSPYFLRTVEHFEKQFSEFQEKGRGDIKKAKNFFNVIQRPMFEIQLDQVSNEIFCKLLASPL